MVAFEIYVNDKYRFKAGAPSAATLVSTLHYLGSQLDVPSEAALSTKAMVPTGHWLTWDPLRLVVGDQVTIRIVETEECDQATGDFPFRTGEGEISWDPSGRG
jgi:hypothetical protein